MTDTPIEVEMTAVRAHDSDAARTRLKARYASERRFKALGMAAVAFAVMALTLLLASVVATGWSAFYVKRIGLEITFDPEKIDPAGAVFAADGAVLTEDPAMIRETLRRADFDAIVRDALKARFPDVSGRRDLRDLYGVVSSGAAYTLRDMVEADPRLAGQTAAVFVRASDEAIMFLKNQIDMTLPEGERRTSDQEAAWLQSFVEAGDVATSFNWEFFQTGDSREPELAGVWGAIVGSFLTMSVTLLLSLPLGIAAAIYLEEFAPKNRVTDIIEVNINNLAAVPSIVFGLLGLAVFLNFFGLPRSAPLVGGLALALMTLPTVIIASRAALKAVPPSIREAALGLGASRMQAVFHHVLPLAAPGIMTGAIIGMAQALGETAPLLMIGMVAFIVDIPQGVTDPATVLPVQIFLWADAPERAFVEKTAAAIMVLLGFLVTMNAIAVILRRRFERRW